MDNQDTSLLKVIQKIISSQVNSFGLIEFKIGLIQSTKPLNIKVNDKIILEESQVVLSEFVLEKAINLRHNHKATTGNFIVKQKEIIDPPHLIDGRSEDELSDHLIIQQGLEIGDKVLMLRIDNAQRYLILSKVRDKKSVIIDSITGVWRWKD